MSSLPPHHDTTLHMPGGSDELPSDLHGNQRSLDVLPHIDSQSIQRVLHSSTSPATSEMTTAGAPPLSPPTRARRTRLGTAMGLTATVAIVAPLAAVIATLRPLGAASTTATGTPLTSVTPEATRSPRNSFRVLPLRATIDKQPGIPVVTPSNPKVIYEYSDNTALPVLQRSDDVGVTWNVLPIPVTSGTIGALTLAVNPTDATNVFLSLALNYAPGAPDACHQANQGERSVTCTQEYVSTDSGEDWSLMHYPLPGTLYPNGVSFSYDASHVQAQGDRLYATLQYHNTDVQPATEIRILSSIDRGATWQLADTALAQQVLHICDFAAAPKGTTLFARTAQSCTGEGDSSLHLWRSDDAGVHWREVTGFAAPFNALFNALIVASTADIGPGAVILYEQVATMRFGFYASLDGGASWQPAPTAGLPEGVRGQVPRSTMQTMQTLSDGSLVVAFSTTATPSGGSATATAGSTPTPGDGQQSQTTIACYVWHPGLARWEPLTQPVITELSAVNLYVADGARRIITLTLADNMSLHPAYTIERFE
jgi:hypothetical protein